MAPAFYIRGSPIAWTAIVLAVLASMGGFIFGYDTGQISDILLMKDFLERFGQRQPDGTYAFSNVREGLIVGMLSIGTLLGALAGSYISNWIGRTRAMSIFCAMFSIGVLIQVCSFHSWVQIMMGRFIAGWGVGALSAAVPVYQSETAPKEIRGTLVATYQLLITFGILVAYCISIGTRNIESGGGSWRTVMAIGWVWALILGIGILFMPESPRWLMHHDRYDDARKSLARVRGVHEDDEHVAYAYSEIETDVIHEREYGVGTWMECFRGKKGIPKLAYRTYLLMMLQSLQQLTGAIIFGAINFGCTFFGLYVMERFGRRWPLIIGGVWQSAWLFAYAGVGVSRDTDAHNTGSFLIAASCLFIFGYASTWAPGIWILTGETFPTRTRQKQASLATAANWTWNFLIAFFTPFITGAIHYAYGFVFAGCNLFGAIFVFFFLYESSSLSLENVNKMYGAPGLKAWQSDNWAPEGYLTRKSQMEESKITARRFSHVEMSQTAPAAGRTSDDTIVTEGNPMRNKQKPGQALQPEQAV